jgi:hypothetical membrane protein
MCALQIHCTLGRGLSTPEERTKAIHIARTLERDPLAMDASANRRWLLNWIIDVPDIRFESCAGLLSPDVGNHYRYSAELNQQVTFSAAAFKLEHPDHLRDRTGAYIAGVEGALQVYEALKSAPDAQLAFLDDLVATRDRGDFADHVARLAAQKCDRPPTELILNVAGAGVGLLLSLMVARWLGRRSGMPGSAVTTTTITRRIVFVCAAYFVSVLIMLHILEPDFDPRFRFMSEYALGNYGWLMTTTFVALGLAPVVVTVGLRSIHPWSRNARIGLGLLTVAGIFVWLAGVFRDSIPHLLAGVVAFPSMVMAVLLLSWTFRQAAGWRQIFAVTLLIAVGMLAAFLSMAADVGMPGLQQRIVIFLFLLWLSIVVHRSVVVTRGP